MKAWGWIAIGVGLTIAGVVVWRMKAPVPALKDGDIVFQTSDSRQAAAIMWGTHSLYSHMGIIRETAAGPVVVEAVGPVKETPLRSWIARGRFGRFSIYRDPDLTTRQTEVVFRAARALYGRGYDLYFSFDNREIYCSELVYDAYHAAGIDLGQVQTIGELASAWGPAGDLLDRRALSDPECRARGVDGGNCIALVRERLLITPKAIAEDSRLRQIYSNYPL